MQLYSHAALLMSRVLQLSIPHHVPPLPYTAPYILRLPFGRSDARAFISPRTTTSNPQRTGRPLCTRTQTLRGPATGEIFPPRLILPMSTRCVYALSVPLRFSSPCMTLPRTFLPSARGCTHLRGPASCPLTARHVRHVTLAAHTAVSGSTRAWRSSRQSTTARATRNTARACCSSAWWTRSGTARRAGRAFMTTRKSNTRAALAVTGRAGRDGRTINTLRWQQLTASAALPARWRLTVVSACLARSESTAVGPVCPCRWQHEHEHAYSRGAGRRPTCGHRWAAL